MRQVDQSMGFRFGELHFLCDLSAHGIMLNRFGNLA